MNDISLTYQMLMPVVASHMAYMAAHDQMGLTEAQMKVLAVVWCYNTAYKYPDASTIAATLNTKNTTFIYTALKKLVNQNLITYTKIYKKKSRIHTSVYTVTGKGADRLAKFSEIIKSFHLS